MLRQIEIIKFIENKHSVTFEELKSKTRVEHIALARNEAYYLLREKCHFTFDRVGQIFSRSHSCVYNIIKQMKANEFVSDFENEIENEIKYSRHSNIKLINLLAEEEKSIFLRIKAIQDLIELYK